jgi:hypothetical protein
MPCFWPYSRTACESRCSPFTSDGLSTWLPELEDAVCIHDAMLPFHNFLDKGEILNFEVPHAQDEGVVWSGLLLGNRDRPRP